MSDFSFTGFGRISEITKLALKTGKPGFSLVIECDALTRFPQSVPVKVFGKATDGLDSELIKVGDIVKVRGKIGGREWNGKYYCDVVATEIEKCARPAEEPTTQVNDEVPF